MTDVLAAFLTAFHRAGGATAFVGGMAAAVFLCWQFSTAVMKMSVGAAWNTVAKDFVISLTYAIGVWHCSTIVTWFADGLAGIGAAASGGAFTGNILSNPGKIVNLGWKALEVQWQKSTGQGWMEAIKQAPVTIFVAICTLSYMATAVLAVRAVVMANAQMMVGSALTPFLILTHPLAKLVGGTGIALIVTASIEIAVKSVLVGIGFAVLSKIQIPAEADLHDIVLATGKVFGVAYICGDFSAANKAVGSLSRR